MPRKRMISPDIWTDEKIGECTIPERWLFIGLISNADDEGIGRANPKLLKSLVFPYDDLRASDLEKMLSHLGALKLIVLYEYDRQTYYNVPNFLKHQTINKPQKSNLPQLQDDGVVVVPYNYGSDTVGLPPKRKEEKIIEEKRKEYIVEIISYLNEKAGTNFRDSSKNNQSHINARFDDGFTLENFKTVINKKCAEWLNTDMSKYLCPDTL